MGSNESFPDRRTGSSGFEQTDTTSGTMPKALAVIEQIKGNNLDALGEVESSEPDMSSLVIDDKREALASNLSFLDKYTMRKALAIRRAVNELDFGDKNNDRYYSLASLFRDRDYNLRAIDGTYDTLSGGLVVDGKTHSTSDSILSDYFCEDRTFRNEDGSITLRGRNYFVSLEKRMQSADRLDVMEADLVDGLGILSEVDRNSVSKPEDFIYYQGILDYMKVHSSVLFHAVTFNERVGRFSDVPQWKEAHIKRRRQAINLMRTLTRMQYQHLLGLPFDESVDIKNITSNALSLIHDVRNAMQSIEEEGKSTGDRFKYPEIHHPLVISLGAREAVRMNENTDTIVAVPSGGTETSIVAQLISEQVNHKSPDIIFLPLSLHSGLGKIEPEDSERILGKVLSETYNGNLTDKSVLLIDDNSCSGTTLTYITKFLESKNVANIAYHLGEYDSRRWLASEDKYKESRYPGYFNPNLSTSTMNISEISKNDNNHAFFISIRRRLNQARNHNKKDIINVYSKNKNITERMLSNFANTPFVLDNEYYASVEGFWQSLYFPENDTMRKFIAKLTGSQAKRLGKKRDVNLSNIFYMGNKIEIGSEQHQALMRKALEAKFHQNELARRMLIKTGDTPIVHDVRRSNEKAEWRESKSIPGEVFAQMLMDIRGELRIDELN